MEKQIPNHIAIIMDGNGRWAKRRGLPRTFGHKEGAAALRKIITHAAKIGVKYLTVYAFSTENWKRSQEEVSALMFLFKSYIKNEEKNIRRALSWGKDIMCEQIVVDTGSSDRTVEIAREMGAKIFSFPWINDFAAAKNFAIDQAKGDWIAFLHSGFFIQAVIPCHCAEQAVHKLIVLIGTILFGQLHRLVDGNARLVLAAEQHLCNGQTQQIGRASCRERV